MKGGNVGMGATAEWWNEGTPGMITPQTNSKTWLLIICKVSTISQNWNEGSWDVRWEKVSLLNGTASQLCSMASFAKPPSPLTVALHCSVVNARIAAVRRLSVALCPTEEDAPWPVPHGWLPCNVPLRCDKTIGLLHSLMCFGLKMGMVHLSAFKNVYIQKTA